MYGCILIVSVFERAFDVPFALWRLRFGENQKESRMLSSDSFGYASRAAAVIVENRYI